MLAVRLSGVAAFVGVMAGSMAYWAESRRVEDIALERAAVGARHWESAAIRLLSGEKIVEEHSALTDLLDRNNFVGIRVFDPNGALVYEVWATAQTQARLAVQHHRHEWPQLGKDHRNRIREGSNRLIQVVLPLVSMPGVLAGYLEGVYRIDEKILAAQKKQIFESILMAIASVIATTGLLYPILLRFLRYSSDLSKRLLESNLSLIRSLGNATAKRDSDTDAHNYRVTLYAVALAEAMCMSEREISHIIEGAFLHDVGKIGIPDRILLKPGKLSDDEFSVMKTHVFLGLEIIAGNEWMAAAAPIIRCHHERFDGSGYPDGLSGATIPCNARLFAIVDVFDALTSARPYKASMPFDEAMSIIRDGSGKHFDPEIFDIFKEIAFPLYKEMNRASNVELRDKLRDTLTRYFTHR